MFESLLNSILKKDLPSMKKLIEDGVNVNGYEDKAKIRPLHYAVQHNFIEGVEQLLAAGASPNAENSDGETPLDIAKAYQNQALINLLESVVK
jgi:ankyrin repeat protein